MLVLRQTMGGQKSFCLKNSTVYDILQSQVFSNFCTTLLFNRGSLMTFKTINIMVVEHEMRSSIVFYYLAANSALNSWSREIYSRACKLNCFRFIVLCLSWYFSGGDLFYCFPVFMFVLETLVYTHISFRLIYAS